MSVKVEVHLTPEQRTELGAICRQQNAKAAEHRRARVVLLADEDHPDGQRPDTYIAAAVGLSEKQVKTIRQRFVREGVTALKRRRRQTPSVPPVLDGRAEAQLIALCCSTPPDGRQRWTVRLLRDELCRLQIVSNVCPETVRKCLKKTGWRPGRTNASAFRTRTGPGSSRRWNSSLTCTTRSTTSGTR